MASYKLQHMGLGGVLDQAIAICKDHFGLLARIMLIVLVPFALVFNFSSVFNSMPIPPNASPQDIAHWQESRSTYSLLVMITALIQSFVVAPLANAAVIQAVARLYLGDPVTAMEAIKHSFKRLGALIGTNILLTLTISGGMLLCLIPGIYFAIWFGLSLHVVVLEGLAGPTAMRRSKKLVHPDRGKFLALGIIIFVISFAISSGANFIPHPYVHILVATLLQAATAIFATAAMVVFYFSARCGVENFDLHYLANAIGEEPATIDAGAPPL